MYQPHEVVVRTGGNTLNYSYNPSIDSKENNVIAYEYKFGNVMERKTGVNLKSINTDNLVEIKYAYLSDQWDKESELVGEDVFTLQKLNNEGDEVYIYILISPNEDWDEVNFSTNVVWYYGIPTQMNIINTNTNTTIKQDIITGQEIETPNIELEDGYEASWYLDKECTIPATFPLPSSVTLYTVIEKAYPTANLPSDYLAWDSSTSIYYVKKGTSTLPADLVIPKTYNDGTHGEANVTYIYGATSSSSGIFYYKGLTSVTFPKTLTNIGSYAFYHCYLTSIDLTYCTSLTSIGEYAFYYCSKLTSSVDLPSSLTSIGNYAFQNCSGLTSIDLSGCDGLTTIEKGVFQSCDGLTNITLPSSLTSIGDFAFHGCDGLTRLDLNGCSSLTSIGGAAFYGCSKLTSITLPSSLTSIWSNAFYYCSKLTSISLPSSLTSIGSYAFQECSGLTSITIPVNVTKIGRYAFGSSSLTSITFSDTSTWYRTSSSDYTNGTETDVTNASTNASRFKNTSGYYDYYWYKL